MVNVLVPLHDGFEEIELVCFVDVLRRAGAKVTIASVQQGHLQLVGANKIIIYADADFEDVKNADFDLIVCAGGNENSKGVGTHHGVIAKLKHQKEAGKWFGGICAAPKFVLEDNGLLEGLQATSYPGMHLHDRSTEDQNVVVCKNCITSRGPGTAIEFGVKLVEALMGKDKAQEVAKQVLFKAH